MKKNEGRGHCALGRERYFLIVSVSETAEMLGRGFALSQKARQAPAY